MFHFRDKALNVSGIMLLHHVVVPMESSIFKVVFASCNIGVGGAIFMSYVCS